MKIFVHKEKSEKLVSLIQSMNKRKYDKMISNIENFCANNVENERIVKISPNVYFYRINTKTRLIFSVVEDKIILYDVYYSEIDTDINIDLNKFFPALLILEFLIFMIFNWSIAIALVALTLLVWTFTYTKSEKNGQNIKNNS